jgi:hypothetical protein
MWKIWHDEAYTGDNVDSLHCEINPSIRRSWPISPHHLSGGALDSALEERSSLSEAAYPMRRTVRKAVPKKLRNQQNQSPSYFGPNAFGVLSIKPRQCQDYHRNRNASRTRRRPRKVIDFTFGSDMRLSPPRNVLIDTNYPVSTVQAARDPSLRLTSHFTCVNHNPRCDSPEPSTRQRSRSQGSVSRTDFQAVGTGESSPNDITATCSRPSTHDSAGESAVLNDTATASSVEFPYDISASESDAALNDIVSTRESPGDGKSIFFHFDRWDGNRQNQAPRSSAVFDSVDKLLKHADWAGVFDPDGPYELELNIDGTSESAFLSWEYGMDESAARQKTLNNILRNAASSGETGQELKVTVRAPQPRVHINTR